MKPNEELMQTVKMMLMIIMLSVCYLYGAQGSSIVKKKSPAFNESEVMDWTWRSLMKLYNNSFPNKEPSGKFYDAALEITKAAAQAHAAAKRSPDDGLDIIKMRKYLKLASKKKNHEFARSALARTLYAFFKIYLSKPGRKQLKIDTISFAAAQFLENVKDQIGVRVFDELVARKGGKTLAFAVDTTGSMTDDIKAARAIAKAIIQEKRYQKVDYILSPFGDPTYGPVIYKSENERQSFLTVLDSIEPHGGGDCKELTFTGILEALNSGPQYGSPLFVLTDASAKDDTGSNMKTAKIIAQSAGITINFFTKVSGCDDGGVKSFRDLAAFTSGQVFPLKSDKELKNLTGFVKDSLDTTQIIAISRSFTFRRRGSRSIRFKHFKLNVDEFVEKLHISVTSEFSSKGLITLIRPNNSIQHPSIELSYSTFYSIRYPIPGKWTLVIEGSVGKYDFIAKVKSMKIIHFGYYFVLIHNGFPSPIPYPVIGEMATVYITIVGARHIDVPSLSLRLIDMQGHTLKKNIRLISLGNSKIHFKASFIPPEKTRFKIVLEGRSKAGTKFTRVAKKEALAKSILLMTLYGEEEFTAVPGKPTMIIIGLHNSRKTEFFKIRSYGASGNMKVLRNRIIARKGRMGFTTVMFIPFPKVAHGDTITVFIVARGEETGRVVSKIIKILVVRPEKFEKTFMA